MRRLAPIASDRAALMICWGGMRDRSRGHPLGRASSTLAA
jgi:hypothetical protein